MYSEESLKQFIQDNLGDRKFIVVSNRQPYEHQLNQGKVVCKRGAGGIITALDPVMQASHGTWIAVGNGTADKKICDAAGRIQVPEDNPKYTLRRVWLNKSENKGYYYGYSNEALWPLCHKTFERPSFEEDDWESYKQVNAKFADAVLDEVGDEEAFVWIQDYHLCLLPHLLRERMNKDQLIIAHFWHIPWPSYETFRICPQKKEILQGLLANDLLGFHINYHCNNFLENVEREVEARINRENLTVISDSHTTKIQAFPISVDYAGINHISQTKTVENEVKAWKNNYNLDNQKIIVGAERIDYTKGLPERFLAIERLLDEHPELIGRFSFLQLGQITRIHIPKYKRLNDELNDLMERINWKYSTDDWQPILFIRQHLSFQRLVALFKLGDVLVVSSLHDGMNLVAKEFISAHSDESGVLVLSKFTGAARELTEALHFNPYDLQEFAGKLYNGILMSDKEKKIRMIKLREKVMEQNIYAWANEMISELMECAYLS
ncbi:MAG: trehalose-6-phosphate synthase [bacterium]|nr:trehalose-6-phosphate synthase [bacterium]